MVGASFGVAKVTLVDETVMEPPLDGMTVFIGPNNAGKSVLLRELAGLVGVYPGTFEPLRWVSSIDLHRGGTSQEFLTLLNERGYEPRIRRANGRMVLPDVPGADGEGIDVEQVISQWDNAQLSGLSHFLLTSQWTDQRLIDQTTSGWRDPWLPPNHPTQQLSDSKVAHARFSELFKNAFGQPIAINRYVPRIRLQIGSTGMEDTPPPASEELREAYEKLPYLVEQGDGMRAFANILVQVMVRPAPVIIIDEPEAFLHPPQARLLGRFLALHTPSPCQVFVATHSADFLSGALEGKGASQSDTSRPLALVRLSRTNGAPAARTLAPEVVTDILDTPLLRYSNIISGLFHDGVVLCEAEGDCHFYAATLDTARGTGQHDNLTFLHVNGKARLADAAHKLRTCGITTAVVADLDLLNDITKVKQALSLLGGVWEDVRTDVLTLQQYVSSTVHAKPAKDVKKEINSVIGAPRGVTALSQQQIDTITSALKTANGWKILKTSGLAGLSGEPYNAAQRLVDYFAILGVFLVPVGELECWVRAVPAANKSLWLSRVFEDGHHLAPSADLRAFSSLITNYLARGR